MPASAPVRSAPHHAPRHHIPRTASEDIAFGVFESALGKVLLGVTARGIRYLALGDSANTLEREMRAALPWASFSRTVSVPEAWREEITRRLSGAPARTDLPVHTDGTPFEESVWSALRRIPHGERRTYQQVAADIGRPTAVRAVAQACAHNNVAVLIPCHRVIRSDGTLGGYRWGTERKQTLLDAESTAPETSGLRRT